MFQSIVERQARAPSIPGVSTGGTASIELVQDVARMQAMLEREGATLAAAYAYFDERIYPQIAKDPAGVPQIVKNQVAAVLLNRLALEKPRDFESGRLPSVTRITEVMIELDVLRPSAWATLVIELIQHIYRQTTVPDAYSSIQDYETAMARRDALLRDLLGAWKAFCAQRPTPESDSPVKQSKPASPGAGANPRQKLTLQQAFGELFPQHLVPNLLKPTFAAFATYKLLTDPVNRSRSIKGDAAPFLQMMQGLISRARPPRPGDFLPISDAFPDLPRFVWPKKQPDGGSGTSTQSMFVYRDKSTELRVAVHRQLGDAIKARNLGAVKKAWLEFWGEAAVPDASRVAQLVQHPDMFDYFILAYTMMQRPQQAIEVWKNMERIGIQATIKTWNSMLQGCINAGNAHGINTVWSRLVASGTKLDKAIWTARIHGLFVCGEPDAGIRALDEMAKIWAARQDPRYAAIAVQPTVEPVNAALAGLLRLKRDSDATKVLAWASRQGISPDIYTFNTLLRPLIRRGDMKGIDEVFDTMRSINIHADIATFTILLEGTLNHVGDLAPDQQVALVERILGAMKASGVEINMQAYAKMLHVLLREGDRAGAPVKAVLAHIWGRGLELTSHIYTMLAEHYFSRDPPDAAAVTALIENRRLRENRGIDRVFWERVVRGYCDAGEIPRALDIFDRVLAAGSTVTLATLYDLLRSLVAAGDLAAARRVVEAGRKIGRAEEPGAGAGAGGLAEGAAGGRYWRHRFWHLAYHHGLLGDQLALRFREANEGSL
ncbi:fde13dda-f3c9-4e75-a452-6aea2c1d8913 [Thermothielavioides terrestris]|uniref:Fde13dda-f3c9-4e75-a452-6aea2c1d8913 n=1 Tax=Thermothielavioides terrestris TaxID=2587410 RepID=A0A3S4ATW8_9PEZI|nr:fde13dda-f3c9-4e75-a452-6aea2c1d8913 [Thermothielavioides terrestris]